MKKALIFIFVICLCFVFSCSKPGDQTFNKEHLNPTMYKMLEMLSEYISRWSVHRVTPRNENLVELFYPREKRLAETFEELIKQYNKELAVEIIFEPSEEVKKLLKIKTVKSKEHFETREKFHFHTKIN